MMVVLDEIGDRDSGGGDGNDGGTGRYNGQRQWWQQCL